MAATYVQDENLINSADEPPSSDQTAKNSSMSQADNLEAFKTITTLLGMLKRSKAVKIYDNLRKSPSNRSINRYERQETKILDSVTQICVGEHDVAALASDRVAGEESRLRLLLRMNSPPIDKVPSHRDSESESVEDTGWVLGIMNNIRLRFTNGKSSKATTKPVSQEAISKSVSKLTIESPSVPKDLEGRGVIEYMECLVNKW